MAILQCEYFSQSMKGFRSFSAVLPIDPPPEGMNPPRYTPGPWPTLYLLHGFSGARNDWLRNSPIEALAGKYRIAVIMPEGENRFYLDNPITAENCGAMIGEELVEVSRGMFNLSSAREDTAIGGLSMGGYGAIRNGLKYTETFGAVMAFSSALIAEEYVRCGGHVESGSALGLPPSYYSHVFGPVEEFPGSDADPVALADRCVKQHTAPGLFLACGSEDFLFGANRAYHEALEQLGLEHSWWVRPGYHNFEFWNQAVAAGLAWWREKPGA